jgi:hypothetical protein
MSIQYLKRGTSTKGSFVRPVGYAFPTGLTSGFASGSLTVDYLVVAGGGGTAPDHAGGGGAGGFRTSAGPSGGGAAAEPNISYR